MNTKTKFGMLIASVALAASGAVCAADAPANPYVQAAGQTLMTNFGLCVRTGYWTPALAEAQGALGQNCQCDTDIIKCEAGAERVTLSADTLFAFNKAVLKPEGIAKLTELTSRMSGLTLDVVMINGYADRIGAAAYNQNCLSVVPTPSRLSWLNTAFLLLVSTPKAKARLTPSSTARILLLRAKSRHSNS